MPNSSSSDMISSTRSSESALRCSTMIFFTFGKVSSAMPSPLHRMGKIDAEDVPNPAGSWSARRRSLGRRRVGPFFDLRLSLLASHDSSEDTVHESTGVVTPEALGDFHGFVDRRLDRYPPIIKQKLIDCKAEQVLVDGGHLLERPDRRGAGQLAVDRLAVGHDPLD